MIRHPRRMIGHVLVVTMLALGFQPGAYAGLVSTDRIVDQQHTEQARKRLQDLLAREDIKRELSALGVDAEQAAQRVDALTDAEVTSLVGKLESAPAGGDALGVVAFVFIVLLVTDILGYTDIFPFVKKTAQ